MEAWLLLLLALLFTHTLNFSIYGPSSDYLRRINWKEFRLYFPLILHFHWSYNSPQICTQSKKNHGAGNTKAAPSYFSVYLLMRNSVTLLSLSYASIFLNFSLFFLSVLFLLLESKFAKTATGALCPLIPGTALGREASSFSTAYDLWYDLGQLEALATSLRSLPQCFAGVSPLLFCSYPAHTTF